MRHITLTGGVGPARAYIPELLADVLDGALTPGRAFDQNFTLDQTPDAYRAMADRQVLKSLIRP
ncbi:hypothetical protein [Streptomyces sp. NPDC005989]|uniref:hypothetical protein n=1 Tax=Streptomyces sp. NPDC005989 TaxID=3156727 RepID=UPI0033CA7454